jgi:regulator of nucleoside diphosphate kinase
VNRISQILLTERDAARLESALRHSQQQNPRSAGGVETLEALLDSAQVVPATAVMPDVVTMNSRVMVEDLADGRRYSVTIVYPTEADPDLNRVSVVSPVGLAMLGARAGERVTVDVPTAARRELLIRGLEFQPEAAGRFDL